VIASLYNTTMAKVTPREAEKLQKMREAQKFRKEEAERKANPPYYKTTWFRVVLVLVVLTIATSFYDYNGGRSSGKAFKKRASSSSKSAAASSKNEEEDSAASSASASGKKRRVYIERDEWERQMRNKETPTGEPRDLYPKYKDMLSSADGSKALPKPEVYLRQQLYQLGRAYQLAEVEQEKQLSKDVGAVAVDIGLHSYVADGAKVLTEIEQNFAYAVEVLKRDKKGVGKIDLTEVLFDCVESIHQNIHIVQTGLLGKVDDVDYEEEEEEEEEEGELAAAGANDSGNNPKRQRRGHQVGMISKHTAELFLLNNGVYNCVQRVLQSTEYAEDTHMSFSLSGRSGKHGMTLVQLAAKYRLHRLIPVFLGLGAPAEGALHIAVANGDVYTTAVLAQMAPEDAGYRTDSYFAGETALQLATRLGYSKCAAHIHQSLVLHTGDPGSEEYDRAREQGQLPLANEYAPQAIAATPADVDIAGSSSASVAPGANEGEAGLTGKLFGGLGVGGSGSKNSETAVHSVIDAGGYEDTGVIVHSLMGSNRLLPETPVDKDGNVIEDRNKSSSNKGEEEVKPTPHATLPAEEVKISAYQCTIETVTSEQLASMSIADVRTMLNRGQPLRFSLSDLLPEGLHDDVAEQLSIPALLGTHGDEMVRATVIPYASRFGVNVSPATQSQGDVERLPLRDYITKHVRGATEALKATITNAAAEGGGDSGSSSSGGSRLSATDIAKSFINPETHTGKPPLYIFGQALNEKLALLQPSTDGVPSALVTQLQEDAGLNESALGASTFAHVLQAADRDERAAAADDAFDSAAKRHIFQFYLGGPMSGAPFHLHGAAFNALVHGRKSWHLLPPSRDLYSSLHPLAFAANGGVESQWYVFCTMFSFLFLFVMSLCLSLLVYYCLSAFSDTT
jgi:hypothetical protein